MSGSGPQVVKGASMDGANISFSAVKVNSVGGKNARIHYNGNKSALYISTPLMTTWGVNEYVDEKTGRKSYDMSLQFPNAEYMNDDQRAFLDGMIAYEEKIKNAATTSCSKEWFNKAKMSAEVVDALWTPMVRYPKDKETGEIDTSRAPALRIKLGYWDDTFSTEVYDPNGVALFPSDDSNGATPVDLITKGSQVATVIQSGGIWFANGKFGTTWKLFQVVVKPRATLRGKCQISLSASELSTLSVADKTDSDTEGKADPVNVADSDPEESGTDNSDDEEEEERARTPTPPPPVKKTVKKVVRRKANAA
mgnify:CR=1 FL=1